jgi:hypothetical protein
VRRAFALGFFLISGCTPEPTKTPTEAPAQTQAAKARTNVDARIDFEEGPDPDYGVDATSVRGVLVIPALSMRRKLFAVPFPYRCRRGESDAGDDLVVECQGDDGIAYARLRAEPGHVIVTARDYGRLDSQKIVDDIALPSGTTVTVFAPLKFPTTR